MRRWAVTAGLALVAAGLVGCQDDKPKTTYVRAYVVHHGKEAFGRLAQEFEKDTGIPVDMTFACRTQLPSIVHQNHDGDVCVTTGKTYLAWFGNAGLGAEPPAEVGELIPVVQVMKGNPKQIETLADLGKPGVRIALGISEGCLGVTASRVFELNHVLKQVEPNIVERVQGEHNVSLAVDGEKIDACVVWESTTRAVGLDQYDIVRIPLTEDTTDPVGAVVLNTGGNRAGARRFVEYLQGGKARKMLHEAGLRLTE